MHAEKVSWTLQATGFLVAIGKNYTEDSYDTFAQYMCKATFTCIWSD